MWASGPVCGLFADNVGPSAENVGLRCRVFAGNVGSIAACLWAHAILIVGRYRYGLSLLLLEVFWTPGVDDICRQVQRQLLRNELAQFYHHRTRKCIPPRKLRREIQ